MGMRVVVSDDIPTTGSGSSTEYARLSCSRPALSALVNNLRSGQKLTVTSLRSHRPSFDLHYLYHPIGIKWGVTTTNPTRTQLRNRFQLVAGL